MKDKTKEKIIELLGRNTLTAPCRHTLMADENGCPFGEDSHLMPFSLAVVLRAIAAEPSKYTCWIDAECFDTPHFLLQKKRARYKDEQPILVWNLEQDNYDAQSQETKDFIGSLLGV